MYNIFDSHAHYDDKKFDTDRREVIAALTAAGVCGVINCGTDIESSRNSLSLAEEYSFFYFACGIHPHDAAHASEDFNDSLISLSRHKKCVAIGEIGLDYHYDFSPREVQLSVFERQLKIALELDMPVVVHSREASEDTLTLLTKYKPRGVLHCFTGSVETAKQVIDLGMHIGLGGAVTFKNARKPCEVAAEIPLERLLLETDAPYMTPEPFRGKRCDSSHIVYTAEKIAELRDMDTQDLINRATQNTKRLFDI